MDDRHCQPTHEQRRQSDHWFEPLPRAESLRLGTHPLLAGA